MAPAKKTAAKAAAVDAEPVEPTPEPPPEMTSEEMAEAAQEQGYFGYAPDQKEYDVQASAPEWYDSDGYVGATFDDVDHSLQMQLSDEDGAPVEVAPGNGPDEEEG